MSGKTINAFFKNKYFWTVTIVAYLIILLITYYKDFYFTGNEPNPIFYLSIPPIDLTGSTLMVFVTSKITRYSFSFWDILKILLFSDVIAQVWENIVKVIYYVIWQYPTILWFIIFPLSLCLIAYLFVCTTEVSWRHGFLFSIVSVISGTLFAIIFISLTGISTPGS
jgi:hypothetical protein